MKLVADLTKGKLTLNDAEFLISNRVRTLRDGTRASYEVIRSLPDDLPYDPMPFPKGTWNVTGMDWQKEKRFDPKTYGPVKIRTDAWQMVNVWELDNDRDYLKETSRQVKDTCYWLHYSESGTTLGCIRIASPEDAVKIANIIRQALTDCEPVTLEVV
jgi:hypothetical protein